MSKTEIIKRPIEHIQDNVKKSAWYAAIESLVILLFGILLVVWPNATVLVIANVLGAVFIIGGIYRIINYFVVKGQNDFFNNELLIGVLALILGITAIVMGEDIAKIFRVIVGIWMIYEALVRVNTAIKLHAVGVSIWSYTLIIALCMLALGLFVTFNSGAIMQIIGWMMIITGVIGIIGDTMFIQQVNTIAEKIIK